VKSCGFLIVRGDPLREFLLMRHADRWDLPKGHLDPGESELDCALRELREETGIAPEDIEIVKDFRFTLEYPVQTPRDGLADKTLVVFLARLKRDVAIQPTEHRDYRWFAWSPPHQIQTRTIDPLLAAVQHYLAQHAIPSQSAAERKSPARSESQGEVA
jgi:8-oxo-dGTP pyrophosphatase MutT (NUDIX family)